MKQTMTVSDFRDAFARADRKDQFSYAGLGLLFEYLEEVDPDYDLDVVALCCDFAEEPEELISASYDIEGDVIGYLENHSQVIGITPTGDIVYASNF
jgi:hypothetical protein